MQVADARAKTHAEHGEGCEVDLGIAVCVGAVLFEVKIAFVVEDVIEDEGCVAVGAFDGSMESTFGLIDRHSRSLEE